MVALGPPGSVPAVDAVKGRGAECDGEKRITIRPAGGGCIAVATFDVEFPIFNFIEVGPTAPWAYPPFVLLSIIVLQWLWQCVHGVTLQC